ncbi:hypothetical protein GCM10009753_71200 [Streptantibioticus ferralitis]
MRFPLRRGPAPLRFALLAGRTGGHGDALLALHGRAALLEANGESGQIRGKARPPSAHLRHCLPHPQYRTREEDDVTRAGGCLAHKPPTGEGEFQGSSQHVITDVWWREV